MSDFAELLASDLSAGAITPASWESLGGDVALFESGTNFAPIAWPVANRAIFVPFQVQRMTIIRQMAWVNGGTLSGNVDVGIYDVAGTKLVSSGSTAQSGTSIIQTVNTADQTLGPGYYYMAMAMDNTTGTISCIQPVTAWLRCLGVQQMASAFPLPSTATFANPAALYLPAIVCVLNAVI